MRHVVSRALRRGGGALICLAAAACGGGGNSLGGSTPPVTPASNVVSVAVDGGPTELANPAINTLYTTVTVCAPGTSTCQTIDNIQVDTGSYGLRLLAQALTLNLPVITSSNGAALVECLPFIDGYSWGPVARVDVQISGESANLVPVQLIGDPRYPNVPADCSSSGPTQEDTIATFGANGILGIGPFVYDCGSFCVNNIPSPAEYYACTQAACQGTFVVLTNQVLNPVTLFTTDNNGTIIVLPNVAAAGAASATGSLIFGIDTESNNQSGTETVLTIDPSTGFLTTIFNGQTLSSSFIDSGSNSINFSDLSVMPCASIDFKGFYCPASTMTFSATLQGANGTSIPESFSVANAQAQATAEPSFTAFPELGGTIPVTGSFDWGLPFFYGRRIANAIEGKTTSAGTGPYVAF